jgi:hypothetical protein
MFREARGREHNDPFDSGLALEISVWTCIYINIGTEGYMEKC